MMKHSKKKYLKSAKIDTKLAEFLHSQPVESNLGNIQFNEMGHGIVLTASNYLISTFKYVDKNNLAVYIPEPDLIVLYFDTGRAYTRHLKKDKENLFNHLTDADALLKYFFNYFSAASISITNLFNSIEASINRAIPDDFIYIEKARGKHGETFTQTNKEGIERDINFEDKIKKVLPAATKKNYAQKHNSKYEFIIKQLKPLRDEVIHAKSFNASFVYQKLYNDMMNFDFERSLSIVKDFINFYHDNLIEECNCGSDLY